MRTVRVVFMLSFCSFISVAFAQTPNDPGEPGLITGKVIDSGGACVPGAKVYVREHNMPQTGAIRYVTTDQNGQFRMANLRPGDYDVYAVPGHSTAMVTRWTKRVHLAKERPVGKVTVQIGSSGNRKS